MPERKVRDVPNVKGCETGALLGSKLLAKPDSAKLFPAAATTSCLSTRLIPVPNNAAPKETLMICAVRPPVCTAAA